MQSTLPHQPSKTGPRFDPYRTTTRVRVVPRSGPPSPQASSSFPSWSASTAGSKKLLRWALVLLAAGAVAVSQPWKSAGSPGDDAVHEPLEPARTVDVERPTRADGASVVLPATVRPWQVTTMHARVSGYLAAWRRDLGARVERGDVLAEIETPELDQEVAQAEGLALEADAAVVQARAERTEAEADLKVAAAQRESARAEVKLAKSELERSEKLTARRVTTREEYETALERFETRTALVAAAESDLARRRANLETRAAIIETREATAASRRANVDRLKELQSFQRIVAPFDGVVTRRAAEVGMLVTAGQDPLFVLEDMGRVRVQVEVPQTYAAQTMPGAAVSVSLPESSAKPVAGTIMRVAESVESRSRTMLAEIEFDNATSRFQPGSFARVTLATPPDSAAWTIPTNTVSMRVDGPHVAIVDGENRVELRPVSLGRDLGRRVVVVDGIQGEERLVVNPGDDLADGVSVRLRDEASNELAHSPPISDEGVSEMSRGNPIGLVPVGFAV